MLILGIETSCDETSVAVLQDKKILSNVVLSQLIHKEYGGIVPELASREHIKALIPVTQKALKEAGVDFADLKAVAVTYGPGLIGSLLVGVSFAKALAYALNLSLIGVNHLEGHLFSNFLEHPELDFPFVCLIISGGHTLLVYVKQNSSYEVLGETRDDASGEAFDKVAKLLNLGYPGGPYIDRLSKSGRPEAIKFPRGMLDEDNFDFSFSGLKTAAALYVAKLSAPEVKQKLSDICASFQEAVVDVLVEKTLAACRKTKVKRIALAGGVACNSRLREKMQLKASALNLQIFYPSPLLCTDNAGMIAYAGWYKLQRKETSNFDLTAISYAKLT